MAGFSEGFLLAAHHPRIDPLDPLDVEPLRLVSSPATVKGEEVVVYGLDDCRSGLGWKSGHRLVPSLLPGTKNRNYQSYYRGSLF